MPSYAFRDPNRRREGNRHQAEEELEAGAVEMIQPGSADPRPAPRSTLAGRLLAIVVAAGAVFVLLNQWNVLTMRSLPKNPDLASPLLLPGETAHLKFDKQYHSVNGTWRGTPTATVENAADLGIEPALTATSHNDVWGDKMYAKEYQKRGTFDPYAKLTIPNNPSLQGKTVRVRVTMPIVYPVTDGNTFRDETTTLTKVVALQVGTANDIRDYWTAWGLAIGVGSFGSLAGGLALCVLGLTLRLAALCRVNCYR